MYNPIPALIKYLLELPSEIQSKFSTLINELNTFKPDVMLLQFSINPEISTIIEDCLRLPSYSFKELTGAKEVNDLRRILKTIYNLPIINSAGVSSNEFVHPALLYLAVLCPLNDDDPITREKIELDDRVVVSTGYQFSLTNLIAYHNNRYYRGSALNELDNNKWLLNPITNERFDEIDTLHIKNAAEAKGILITGLNPVAYEMLPPLEEDTAVSSAITPAFLAATTGTVPILSLLHSLNSILMSEPAMAIASTPLVIPPTHSHTHPMFNIDTPGHVDFHIELPTEDVPINPLGLTPAYLAAVTGAVPILSTLHSLSSNLMDQSTQVPPVLAIAPTAAVLPVSSINQGFFAPASVMQIDDELSAAAALGFSWP